MSSDKRHQSVKVEFDGKVITPEPKTTEDGGQLLDDLIAYCKKYVRLHEVLYVIWATWVLHCHAFKLKACTRTPYIHVSSPTDTCGKTQLMEITVLVVPEAILLASCTSSVLARAIENWKPVMLLDEIDKVLSGNKDLLNAIFPIINSGYKKSGYRIVNEQKKGEEWKPKKLSTFCPKMLCGISSLPPDTLSRCVPFEMERMLPNDRVAEIDEYIIEPEAQKIFDRAQKWAKENQKKLRDARPDSPASLGHRQREISRPLFAVGDVVGGDWPERIRAAVARVFADRNASPSANVRVQLLQSIKEIFDDRGCDRMSSADMVQALVNREEEPWATWSKGKPITQNKAANILGQFKEIKERRGNGDVWIDGRCVKGYLREWLEPAWDRYLPPAIPLPPTQTASPREPASLLHETQISNRDENISLADQKREKPASLLASRALAVQSQGKEANEVEASGNGRRKQPWTNGLACPGCMGVWHSGSALSSHLPECPPFDFAAMKLTELRLTNGQKVAPELWDRYQRYLELGLGPLAGRRGAQA